MKGGGERRGRVEGEVGSLDSSAGCSVEGSSPNPVSPPWLLRLDYTVVSKAVIVDLQKLQKKCSTCFVLVNIDLCC